MQAELTPNLENIKEIINVLLTRKNWTTYYVFSSEKKSKKRHTLSAGFNLRQEFTEVIASIHFQL